jgi:hypothetical protein
MKGGSLRRKLDKYYLALTMAQFQQDFSETFSAIGEKEVLKVSKLDPIFIPLQFYYFKNNKLTIISLRSLLRFFN